ncbi:MAG: lactoylglutathione lyase [Bermanella sp.]
MTTALTNTSNFIPSRILHTMFRVSDLDRSVNFYESALGMKEFSRKTFTEGRFTLVFMGYGHEASNPSVELTYNWDSDTYQHGTRYGHIALEVGDIHAACDRLAKEGVTILRDPSPMSFTSKEAPQKEIIAFIEDPDGYKIELIQA